MSAEIVTLAAIGNALSFGLLSLTSCLCWRPLGSPLAYASSAILCLHLWWCAGWYSREGVLAGWVLLLLTGCQMIAPKRLALSPLPMPVRAVMLQGRVIKGEQSEPLNVVVEADQQQVQVVVLNAFWPTQPQPGEHGAGLAA